MFSPDEVAQITQIVRQELGLRDGEASLIGQFAGAAPAGHSTIRKGLDEKIAGNLAIDRPVIVQDVVAAVVHELTADPGPLATLLYARIRDGVWEQLAKYGQQIGYNPKP